MLLQLADQRFAVAFDFIDLVVRQLAPIALSGACELLPLTFDDIPVHFCVLHLNS